LKFLKLELLIVYDVKWPKAKQIQQLILIITNK